MFDGFDDERRKGRDVSFERVLQEQPNGPMLPIRSMESQRGEIRLSIESATASRAPHRRDRSSLDSTVASNASVPFALLFRLLSVQFELNGDRSKIKVL